MPILETHTYIPQLFWLIISFLLLYFLLSKFCLPKLNEIFKLRDKQINGALKRAELAHAEAVKLKDDYERKLAEAARAKNAMIADAMHELSIEIEKKNADTDLHFAQMMQDAEKDLENYIVKSKTNIDMLAKETAKEILKDFLKIEANDEVISDALKEANKTRGMYAANG